jgi:CelD/BcsL family acetyltransferase involved in cellulose biosynthesis
MKPRTWLYLEPGEIFDDFLGGKQKRTRNTLKRRVKKLREHGGGALECTRIEDEDQVDSFYESALRVAEKSWQFTGLGRAIEETALYRESLVNLARMGCLRAYLLSCGGQPCAFVIGYQHEDVLQFEQTAYDGDLGIFSPGTVLYYLLIEDLYRHRPPKYLNYGVGVNRHKRLFSNRSSQDTEVYLFRPTLRNRVRSLGHGAFYSALGLAKKLLKKGPDDSADDEEE